MWGVWNHYTEKVPVDLFVSSFLCMVPQVILQKMWDTFCCHSAYSSFYYFVEWFQNAKHEKIWNMGTIPIEAATSFHSAKVHHCWALLLKILAILLCLRKHGISSICVVIEWNISCQTFPDTSASDLIKMTAICHAKTSQHDNMEKIDCLRCMMCHRCLCGIRMHVFSFKIEFCYLMRRGPDRA